MANAAPRLSMKFCPMVINIEHLLLLVLEKKSMPQQTEIYIQTLHIGLMYVQYFEGCAGMEMDIHYGWRYHDCCEGHMKQ